MKQLSLLLKSYLILLLSLFALSFSSLSFAQDKEDENSLKAGDRVCLTCHKNVAMQGAHANAVSPNNLKDITCTNCHGRISKEHRDGVKDVMRYHGDMYSVEDKNSICLSCHEPDKLREAFWQHDVHMTKLACSSCHVLHTNKDPMEKVNQDKGAKIKLCVDCHSNIHNKVIERAKP